MNTTFGRKKIAPKMETFVSKGLKGIFSLQISVAF